MAATSELAISLDEPRTLNHANLRKATAATLRDSEEKLHAALMSLPRSVPHRTPPELVELVVLLRRLRMTGAEIAFCLGMALSTVSAALLRVGLGKRSRLEPPEPPNRYERRQAGELLHVDVKKLGRIPTGRAGLRRHPRLKPPTHRSP
jgi:hypothetical protein